MTDHWMDEARCKPDQSWTSETRPPFSRMSLLASICESCPVQARCAQEALDTNADGGVYAGVYVPLRGTNRISLRWLQARDQLQRRVEGAA